MFRCSWAQSLLIPLQLLDRQPRTRLLFGPWDIYFKVSGWVLLLLGVYIPLSVANPTHKHTVHNGSFLPCNSIRFSSVPRLLLVLQFYSPSSRGAAAGSTFISVGPPGKPAHAQNTSILSALIGFTALTILQLGSWGRQM